MAPKRKNIGSSAKEAKKSKTSSEKQPENSLLSTKQIIALTNEVQESNKKYNNIVQLINQFSIIIENLSSNKNFQNTEKVARSLCMNLYKIFEKLLKDKLMITRKSDDEKKVTVTKWLLSKYESFKAFSLQIISTNFNDNKTSLQLDLLDIYLNLVKLESEFLRNKDDLYFPVNTYKQLVESILLNSNSTLLSDGTSDNFIILEFLETFSKNWDLQFYLINNLNENLNEWKETKTKSELELIFSNFFTLIRNGLLLNDNLQESETLTKGLPSAVFKTSTFKTQFQRVMVVMLSFPITIDQYKSVLLVLHKRIIPYMSQPQGLMDFLTDSYNVGGVVSILSLNSLFELMKNYNLEYPDFYSKLYSLLNQELLHTKYKSRFFRLVDLFLSSTHLSAALIASFIKRMSRLSLSAGASGIVIVIPFIYNLLKKHPSCMVMLHNTKYADEYQDPFNNKETDPLKTQAITSSLWELETLMSHYHPNIATLAKIFGEPFRKYSYNMEDFLDWSYVSLLDSENTRRYKKEVALEYEEWDSFFNNTQGSSYVEGWSW